MRVNAGSTDISTYFILYSAADNSLLTGATITNIDLVYLRSGSDHAAKVDATALGSVNAAHGDNQAIEIDATFCPGMYRIDWPDAAFAAGAREVILTVLYTGAYVENLRVELAAIKVDVDTIKTQTVTCGAGVTILASVGTAATATAQTGDTYALANGAAGFVAIDTVVDSIKVMTDKIGTITNTGGTATLGAILGDFANTALVTRIADIHTDIVTVTGYIDTEINAVKVDTTEILTRIPDATAGATGGLAIVGSAMTIDRTTAAVATEAGNTATAFKTTLASSVDNFWKGSWLKITSGALAGQVREVSSYTGATTTITVSPAFTGIPADGVTFVMVNE